MERSALTFLGVIFALELMGIIAQDNTEAYTLYFRKGREKVPVRIELDLKEKTAHVHSESPTSVAAISLYDYKARAIAFKDETNKTCYIERMHDPSIVYERRLIRSLRNQVLFGSPETLYAAAPSLTKKQLLARGGKKIYQFCKNAKTFIISGKWKSESGLRKKRDLHNGYLQRSYSHHEQHTQSYAKFGHEHLSYHGINPRQLKRVFQTSSPSYIPPQKSQTLNLYKSDASSYMQKSEDDLTNVKKSSTGNNLKKANQRINSEPPVTEASINRIVREAPKSWPQAAPVYLRAGGETSQVLSHINSNPASSAPGFTATGRFNLANTNLNGYGNGQLAAQGRASTGYSGADLNAEYQKTFVPNYGSNGGYGSQMYPSQGQIPSYTGNGHGPSSVYPSGVIPGKSTGHQPPPTGTSGYYPSSQQPHSYLQPSVNGYPPTHRDQQGYGQPTGLHHGGQTSPTNGFPRYTPSAQNGHIPQQNNYRHQTGLSSQSQVRMDGSQINAGASAQGALNDKTAQTQVQGNSSPDGSFQAQAQSGSGYGSSQSQTQGSETGAQSSSTTHIQDLGQSQSQAQLSSESRMAQASAQTASQQGLTSVQSQGNGMGGQASSQAQGFSGIPSSANAGVSFDGDQSSQTRRNGYIGHASANSQGGLQDGQSQTQVHGNLQSGSPYTASAQSGYGTPETSQGPLAIALPGSGQQNYLIPQNGRTIAQQGVPQPGPVFQPDPLSGSNGRTSGGKQYIAPGYANGGTRPFVDSQYPGIPNGGARRTQNVPASHSVPVNGFHPNVPFSSYQPPKGTLVSQQQPGSGLHYPVVHPPVMPQLPSHTGSTNGHFPPPKSQTMGLRTGYQNQNGNGQFHSTSGVAPAQVQTNGQVLGHRGAGGNGFRTTTTAHQPSVPFHNGQYGKSQHSILNQPTTSQISNGHFPVSNMNTQNIRTYPDAQQTDRRIPASQMGSGVNPQSSGFGTPSNCDSASCLQGFRIIKSVKICMLPVGCQ